MNINEVPQDPKDFKEGDKLRKKVYAVDKDGKYTGVTSAGWEVENFAMKQAWDAVDENLEEAKNKVISGELSPIPYFMQKNLMDVALLAKYIGKWQWQVRRHFKPDVFKKLNDEMLKRYADTFNIPVQQLVSFGKKTD